MKGEAAKWLLSLVYPRRCPFCDEVIGRKTQCGRCAAELKELWLQVPRLPMTEHSLEPLSGAAAVLCYEGIAQEAVLRMKNGGRASYASLFAAEMARRIFGCRIVQQKGVLRLEQGPALRQYGLVVAVPPSPDSKRGYNVPDLIAKPLAEYLGAEYEAGTLAKIRSTGKQEGKSAKQRLTDVKDAYRVQKPDLVEGQRILLVDDVITTGGTVSECAKMLLKAGAAEVFAVSVAETQFKGITNKMPTNGTGKGENNGTK